jgi:hypothetical protein
MEVGEGYVDLKRMTCLPLPLAKNYLLICLFAYNSHILCLFLKLEILESKNIFSPQEQQTNWARRKAQKMPLNPSADLF